MHILPRHGIHSTLLKPAPPRGKIRNTLTRSVLW